MSRKTLTTYLHKYSKLQKDIRLVHRPTLQHNWGHGIMFMGPSYSSKIPYNHRSILEDEVVIEFDNDNRIKNRQNALKIRKNLEQYNINYTCWYSGNKSYHIHFLLTLPVSNKPQLKRAITKYLTKDLNETPDMQLCGGHLIRAEYGINEKTGLKKTLVKETVGYPKRCEVPSEVYDIYLKDQERIQKMRMTKAVTDISNSNLVKQLLDTTYFSDKLGDGRERIVFALSNVLISRYEPEELVDLLWNWYRYTKGSKLTKKDIKYKVQRVAKNPYIITKKYLINLLEDLK